MKKNVRFIAQCIDADSGELIEESILNEKVLSKAETLKELGYIHIEQIDFLQQIQDFKIKHQIILNTINICPSTYIANNKAGIVNYEKRKNNGLVFTSNFAESTINTLINARQKGKQKMLWSREGAHNVLQIRAAQRSKSWDNDWKSVENRIYKLAA